mgnify:CR=1 FL=1
MLETTKSRIIVFQGYCQSLNCIAVASIAELFGEVKLLDYYNLQLNNVGIKSEMQDFKIFMINRVDNLILFDTTLALILLILKNYMYFFGFIFISGFVC